MSSFDLKSKTALITGSYRGLGLAIARGLARHGARVVLNGRNGEAVDASAGTLRREGLEATGYPFDVTDEGSVKEQIKRVEIEIGPIDILVNNAGINRRGPAVDFATTHYRTIMRTNLDGVFFVCREVGRRMVARRRGKIINIGSLAGQISRPQIAPYSASKGAVHMLTRGLAVEWARHNVQVNAIAPGFIQTEMTEDLRGDPEFSGWVESRVPVGRWGTPEDLVGAAVFLASPASDYVTGHTLFVDGGWSASF